jgi:peptide deformylase
MEFNLKQHDSLSQASTDWNFATDGDSEKLESDMIKFMIDNNGIGLAANQINLTKRVFTIGNESAPGFPKPFAVFNPVILDASKDTIIDTEGCLSYPGLLLKVKRPEWIVAQWQDSKGDWQESKLEGYLSKCFQHEFDHLNGICFVDRVSQLKLQLAYKKLRKLNDRAK